MKKIIMLVWIVMGGLTVYAQEAVAYILKAKALTEAGKPEQAISLLNQALTVNKESRLYTQRADAFILKGEYSAAINDYNEERL